MEKISKRAFLKRLLMGGAVLGTAPQWAFGRSRVTAQDHLPVFDEVDICVLGGSCTGVFAAVRAARLGASVALVEQQGCFGGVATSSLVNIWHSLYDTVYERKIIGGLTDEVIARMKSRNAVISSDRNESVGYTFNSQELKIDLDELVIESGLHPYLHTLFSEPYLEGGRLTGVIVDSKSGRGIIKAHQFIDATGDGDLCVRLGVPSYTHSFIQPPTTCAYFEGFNFGEVGRLIKEHGDEFDLKPGFIWGSALPGTKDQMVAGTRVLNRDCAEINDLTMAEIEGRRQVRAIMDLVRKYGESKIGLAGLPSYIGIRESRHVKCRYQVSDEDALHGRRFEDAIANGSYRFDVHHQDKPGVTFRYLNGKEVYNPQNGQKSVWGRWRPEQDASPTFYQIPLRSLIPQNTRNVILAGRMLDAAPIAYSGMRVMVNMNQVGEAAGVTACLALKKGCAIADVPSSEVRALLADGGSVII